MPMASLRSGTIGEHMRKMRSYEAPVPSTSDSATEKARKVNLEKKIDGLVSLLAAGQGIQANSRPPMTPESPETLQSQLGLIEESENICTDGFEGAIPSDVSKDLTEFELFPGFHLTNDEAERYLAVYRSDYLPKYPFVPISPLTTCLDLYSQSRFLFWSIMAVVVPLPCNIQPLFKTWFRRYVAEHMLVRQEKRLEILQAILVYLGWNDFHFYIEMQATNLLQLAMALVIDLKLDRPPGSIGVTTRSLISDAWSRLAKPAYALTTPHTSDEKRAVLGFHHISCLVAALFRRGCQLHWNNYMAQCCDSLAQEHEFETDIYLAALLRMQHIADRVYGLLPGAIAEFHESATAVFRAPLEMAMNGVRREMEEFVKSQPESIQQNKYFMAHYHIFLLRLYEPVIAMKSASPDCGGLASEPFQRSEALWKCLQFGSDFFDHQLSIPVGDIPTLPFTASGLLAFAIVSLSRIMLLESATDWDPALARKRVDFANLMKKMSEQFDDVERMAKELGRRTRVLDDGSSVYLKYGFKLRWIRHWYLVRAPQEQQQPPAEAQNNTASMGDLDIDQWNDIQIDQNFWQQLMTVYDADLLAMDTSQQAV